MGNLIQLLMQIIGNQIIYWSKVHYPIRKCSATGQVSFTKCHLQEVNGIICTLKATIVKVDLLAVWLTLDLLTCKFRPLSHIIIPFSSTSHNLRERMPKKLILVLVKMKAVDLLSWIARKSSVTYYRIQPVTDILDDQFKEYPQKSPVRSIILACILFIIGICAIIVGVLLLTGYLGVNYQNRTWPVLLFGFLIFIPGVYHIRIAFLAWRGRSGFSFHDIPQTD
ncbi:hypothetical protein GJ496_001986 [Pomphorhynchus laevis]|nr:hypothetical protein GJ496_001986 [Pomphorhynchus laevis]